LLLWRRRLAGGFGAHRRNEKIAGETPAPRSAARPFCCSIMQVNAAPLKKSDLCKTEQELKW
jgi:hypothetical protein